MEKPKIIIVGIDNDKEACIKAIKAVETLGFETIVIDPKKVLDSPKQTIFKLQSLGTLYEAKAIYRESGSKYHR